MLQRADIEVRRCTAEELPQIVSIEERYIPCGWSEKGFSEWLELNENAVIFGAFDGDKLIGFVNGASAFEEAELLNIAVEEEYRRQGIAQMLFDTLFQHFKGKGVERIFLEVREKNATAVGFYKKNGFEQVGLRKNYYREPADNAVVMQIVLNQCGIRNSECGIMVSPTSGDESKMRIN